MKRHWLIMAAFLLLASVGATTARADHILAATLNWEPTDQNTATNEIRFNAIVYFNLARVAGRNGLPAIVTVGSTYCAEPNEFEIDFGDGTPHANPLCFKVTVVNTSENWIEAIALNPATNTPGVLHTYSSCTQRTAVLLGRWRATIHELNNRGSNFDFVEPADWLPVFMRLESNVSPCATNKAPVSTTSLPIIHVCEAPSGDFRTFAVTAIDSDPGDNITYRIASNTEATGDTTKNGPPSEAGQSEISINPTTGIVTWYNHGLASPKYYSIQVTAVDHHGSSADITRTPIDFLLVVDPDVTAPTYDLSISPNTCSPPSHQMIEVTAAISNIADGCDPNPSVTLDSIRSNQADAGLGTGDLPNDVQQADTGTDDRVFLLRCEAYTTIRVYTIYYTVTDGSGNKTNHQADFTVVPPPPPPTRPKITVTLTPNTCNDPCSHSLVNVHANVTVTSTCTSTYTVRLLSITSNQDESGLGCGDVQDDIQNDTVNIDDRDFKLRCEAIGGNRTYTIEYRAFDACGGADTASTTFTVSESSLKPHISFSLSPNSCNDPCDHDLVTVCANISATACGSYTVQLLSITSNQAESGLSSGDVADDIQQESLNTDDRTFKLRCEAVGGTRTYTVKYRVVDACGRADTATKTFTVQPSGSPNVSISLSPSSCNNPCDHDLVNVHAYLNVSNCQSGYTVKLVSITSNQAQSGLGYGDESDDIQYETLNTDDRDFKLRCEAIGGIRTYTVTYCVTDPCGASKTVTACFTVRPGSSPNVSLSLSPCVCTSPCTHTLVNVHANIGVSNCQSGYTVKLVSITSNQADAGLGSGDVADDIQNETLNTDDRDFKLRCEAIGGTRCYTVTYCVTDPCGATKTISRTFTIEPAPTIHVSLSPNSCSSPCNHSLVNVYADVDVTTCSSNYSVQLISLTSSQHQSGLGSGDVADDIQNESLNTNDCSFKLRCEAIGANRTYTATYRVTDASGATATASATFCVQRATNCGSSGGDCDHDDDDDDDGGWGWHKQSAETGDLSSAIMLEQNHPNPFSSITDIDYSVAQSGNVTIEIIDMQGERVRTLYNGDTKAGKHTAQWDGMDDRGKPVKSGGYLYRVVAASCGCTQTRQLILMR